MTDLTSATPPVQSPSDPAAKLDAIATALAGSFATVTLVLGALGAKEGGLDRMLRNHFLWSAIAFALVVGAIGLAGLARSALVSEPTDGWRSVLGDSAVAMQRRLLLLGSLMFAFGLVVATILAVKTPSDTERPSLSAFVDPSTKDLNVTVKASGLASKDRIQIIVNGLYPTSKSLDRLTIERASADLYESTVGPNSAGVVDVSLKIPIPSGTFDRVAVAARSLDVGDEDEEPSELDDETCKRAGDEGRGCVLLRLAPSSVRPRIDSVWESFDGGHVFVLTFKADDVDYNAGVSVRVKGVRRDGPPVDLYSMLLAPDPDGAVASTVKVPVGRRISWVCAAAVIASPTNPSQDYRTLVTDGPRCPPDVKPLTAWTKSRVPKKPAEPEAETGQQDEAEPEGTVG